MEKELTKSGGEDKNARLLVQKQRQREVRGDPIARQRVLIAELTADLEMKVFRKIDDFVETEVVLSASEETSGAQTLVLGAAPLRSLSFGRF